MQRKPYLLLILDGWGHREAAADNAISVANTPVWDRLWRDQPTSLLSTSGAAVGLPDGQMGNSEVGHMNLGLGRVVYQDFTRISRAIDDGTLDDNPVLCDAIDLACQRQGAVHLLGLLSPGGVHSHQDHLLALAALAVRRGAQRVYLHAFLDGRDTPPKSAGESVAAFEQSLAVLPGVAIASVIGRYYAMDRDQRWSRVQTAFELITQGCGEHHAASAVEAVAAAYQRGESDEFVGATVIDSAKAPPVGADDALIFGNFRADRAREISQALCDRSFDHFDISAYTPPAAFVTLTEYDAALEAQVAFPAEVYSDSFGDVIAAAGLTQLRAAETEKYAHVTFFFNGGREALLANERRALIPSPSVATYDLQPAMSAEALTDRLVESLRAGDDDVIVCNYANPDMVGHTGDLKAAAEAAEVVDRCLRRILDALRESGGEMLITADHGNLEQMYDPSSGQAHTAHTTNPVPLVYIGRPATLADGALCDVAPTMLALMGLPAPAAMTGRSLVTFS